MVSAPAQASFETGNELYQKCKPDRADYSGGFCLGYLSAVVDTHFETVFLVYIANSDRKDVRTRTSYCLRDQVTLGQVRDVVNQYLEKNPAERDKEAASLVIKALAEAFPCAPS